MSRGRGPRLSTVLRLAVSGGRSDSLRIVLTAIGALVATSMLLLGVAVTAVGPDDGPYFTTLLSESGLHPGVVFAMVLLSLVSLSFVGQCSRIGAPERDRRLAAIRMAGGTPRDARTVLAAETFCAAALGSVLAGVLYLVMHQWFPIEVTRYYTDLGERTSVRGLLLPTDVLPHPVAFLIMLLVIPLGATLLGLVALRRTALTPFGVTRRVAHRPPAMAPFIVFVIGAGGLTWFSLVRKGPVSGELAFFLLIPLLFVLTAVGVIFGSASVAYQLGRFLAPRTRRPALLIACRRMIDAPFTASRSSAAVVLAVLIGAAAQGLRANILIAISDGDGSQNDFFATAFDLVDIVVAIAIGIGVASLLVVAAEGVVTRRRTLAALVATGVPRRTLATATLLEVVAPLLPAVLITTLVGVLAARGVYGTSAELNLNGRTRTVAIPIPWVNLTVLAVGTLLVATAITALSLLFLRRATDLTELRTAA